MNETEKNRLINSLRRHLHLPTNFTCHVELVDKDAIQQINKTTRNIDAPTDCLSLPLYDTLDEARAEAEQLGDEFSLGDILICEEIAAQKKYPATALDVNPMEICLVHGYLHLLGYDHIKEEDAERMEELEDRMLQKWLEL